MSLINGITRTARAVLSIASRPSNVSCCVRFSAPPLKSCVRATPSQSSCSPHHFMPIRNMAGHSKWAKIARSKGANDAAKAVTFSKMSCAISAAVKAGGPDPTSNLRLAAAIEKAKESNVPKDVVERAIRTGADTSGVEEIVLEGMGPGGVAVLVETLTSNRKKTTIGVRHIFKEFDCDLGSTVAFMFESRGRIIVPCTKEKQEEMLEVAAAIEAQDVTFYDDDKVAYIWTDPGTVQSARKALVEEHKLNPSSTDVVRFPKVNVDLPEDLDEKFANFIGQLEDHEDVQNVYHNATG